MAGAQALFILAAVLLQQAAPTGPSEARLGEPMVVVYGIPQGYRAGPIREDSSFSVIWQRGDSAEVVPLLPDTLQLPPLTAWSGEDTLQVILDPIPIIPRFPDSVYDVSAFHAPLSLRIPPGYPADYLRRLMFWITWGKEPGGRFTPAAVAGLLLLAALAIGYLLRRRKRQDTEPAGDRPVSPGLDPSGEAMALLEHPSFAAGDWETFYREYDRLLRDTISHRFGLSNRALTYRQINSRLREQDQFLEQIADPVREIILQRYAGWGSTRDRAERFVRKLAGIRERWHR